MYNRAKRNYRNDYKNVHTLPTCRESGSQDCKSKHFVLRGCTAWEILITPKGGDGSIFAKISWSWKGSAAFAGCQWVLEYWVLSSYQSLPLRTRSEQVRQQAFPGTGAEVLNLFLVQIQSHTLSVIALSTEYWTFGPKPLVRLLIEGLAWCGAQASVWLVFGTVYSGWNVDSFSLGSPRPTFLLLRPSGSCSGVTVP